MSFVSQGTGNQTKIKMAVKDESLSYSLDHFTEVQEVTTLIESIRNICHDDILLEAAEERFIGEFTLFFLLFTSQSMLSKFSPPAASSQSSRCIHATCIFEGLNLVYILPKL